MSVYTTQRDAEMTRTDETLCVATDLLAQDTPESVVIFFFCRIIIEL